MREAGRRCLVVDAPFHHRGGGTRTEAFARNPERERRDLRLRKIAADRFLAKWGHRLPCDVRPRPARVREWVTAKLAPARRG